MNLDKYYHAPLLQSELNGEMAVISSNVRSMGYPFDEMPGSEMYAGEMSISYLSDQVRFDALLKIDIRQKRTEWPCVSCLGGQHMFI